ncbi:hypothetical protein [Caldiplasma sukawensis]
MEIASFYKLMEEFVEGKSDKNSDLKKIFTNLNGSTNLNIIKDDPTINFFMEQVFKKIYENYLEYRFEDVYELFSIFSFNKNVVSSYLKFLLNRGKKEEIERSFSQKTSIKINQESLRLLESIAKKFLVYEKIAYLLSCNCQFSEYIMESFLTVANKATLNIIVENFQKCEDKLTKLEFNKFMYYSFQDSDTFLINYVTSLIENGNNYEAKILLRNIKNEKIQNIETYMNFFNFLINNNFVDEAYIIFEEIKNTIKNPNLFHQIEIQIKLKKGLFNDVILLYEKYKCNHNLCKESFLDACISSGNLKAALDKKEQIIIDSSEKVKSYLCKIEVRMNKISEAEEIFSSFSEDFKYSSEGILCKCEILLGKGETKEFHKVFSENFLKYKENNYFRKSLDSIVEFYGLKSKKNDKFYESKITKTLYEEANEKLENGDLEAASSILNEIKEIPQDKDILRFLNIIRFNNLSMSLYDMVKNNIVKILISFVLSGKINTLNTNVESLNQIESLSVIFYLSNANTIENEKINELRSAISSNDCIDFPEFCFPVGLKAFKEGNYNKMEQILKKFSGIENDPFINFFTSVLYYKGRNFKKAETYIKSAITDLYHVEFINFILKNFGIEIVDAKKILKLIEILDLKHIDVLSFYEKIKEKRDILSDLIDIIERSDFENLGILKVKKDLITKGLIMGNLQEITTKIIKNSNSLEELDDIIDECFKANDFQNLDLIYSLYGKTMDKVILSKYADFYFNKKMWDESTLYYHMCIEKGKEISLVKRYVHSLIMQGDYKKAEELIKNNKKGLDYLKFLLKVECKEFDDLPIIIKKIKKSEKDFETFLIDILDENISNKFFRESIEEYVMKFKNWEIAVPLATFYLGQNLPEKSYLLLENSFEEGKKNKEFLDIYFSILSANSFIREAVEKTEKIIKDNVVDEIKGYAFLLCIKLLRNYENYKEIVELAREYGDLIIPDEEIISLIIEAGILSETKKDLSFVEAYISKFQKFLGIESFKKLNNKIDSEKKLRLIIDYATNLMVESLKYGRILPPEDAIRLNIIPNQMIEKIYSWINKSCLDDKNLDMNVLDNETRKIIMNIKKIKKIKSLGNLSLLDFFAAEENKNLNKAKMCYDYFLYAISNYERIDEKYFLPKFQEKSSFALQNKLNDYIDFMDRMNMGLIESLKFKEYMRKIRRMR